MKKREQWSKEEDELIMNGLSDDDIMELTGRTVLSIQTRRYHLTGHYTPNPPHKYTKKQWNQKLKENRIYVLAGKLGVRIKGVGRPCSY